jgi:hypothetical protein
MQAAIVPRPHDDDSVFAWGTEIDCPAGECHRVLPPHTHYRYRPLVLFVTHANCCHITEQPAAWPSRHGLFSSHPSFSPPLKVATPCTKLSQASPTCVDVLSACTQQCNESRSQQAEEAHGCGVCAGEGVGGGAFVGGGGAVVLVVVMVVVFSTIFHARQRGESQTANEAAHFQLDVPLLDLCREHFLFLGL